MDRQAFHKATQGLESNHREYKAALKAHAKFLVAEAKYFNKRQAMIKRFEELAQDVRQALQISKIRRLSDAQLIEVGKSLNELHKTIRKNGLIKQDRTSSNWSDY